MRLLFTNKKLVDFTKLIYICNIIMGGLGISKFVNQSNTFFKKSGKTLNRALNQTTSALSKGANFVGKLTSDPGIQLATAAFAPELLPALETGNQLAHITH